jgi:predicted RNA-binding protein with PUA domain
MILSSGEVHRLLFEDIDKGDWRLQPTEKGARQLKIIIGMFECLRRGEAEFIDLRGKGDSECH